MVRPTRAGFGGSAPDAEGSARPAEDGARLKVSVVVPVYNPGAHIDPLLDSLAAQSLPAAEFEAIFVDDGSTDDTPARLDRLAADRPNVRVIHQQNSGWPGQPRNVGIEAARGEYVFFSDNDDWFGAEALERLYAMAQRTGADVVIGKMAGHNRGVPRELFRRTVERATLADTPLIDSLTPHKLFRRAFLDTAGLRFPEGKRRLEDHVFVVRAYFAADRIAVLSDYVCYHHIGRSDASNAGFTDIHPPSYYGYVRETLDVIEANTAPGALRDRLLRRFLRQEMLGRLDGRRVLTYDADYRMSLFTEVQRLARERFPETVDAGLPGRQRLLARVVRTGGLEDVLRLAAWSADVRARPRLTGLRWTDGVLEVDWQARLGRDGGGLLRRDGDRLLLAPPTAAAVGDDVLDVTADLRRVRADLVARLRDGGDDVLLTTSALTTDADGGALLVTGTSRLDPTSAGSGAALAPGVWDISVRLAGFGWSSDVRIGAERTPAAEAGCRPAFVGDPARLVLPYWTVPHGNLSVDLDGAVKSPAKVLTPARGRASLSGRAVELALELPVRSSRPAAGRLQLRHRPTGGRVDVAARLEPDGGRTTVRSDPVALGAPGRPPTGGELALGRWELLLVLPAATAPVPLRLDLVVPQRGAPVLRDAPPRSPAGRDGHARAGSPGRSWVLRLRRRLRRRAGRLARELGLRRALRR